MSLISVPNTFSAGAVIIASQHNANFSTIYSDFNGNIDNTNISASAAIAYSKLNLALGVVNADVSASAAIVDTKLAAISTAGKVSGAALTSLSSTPGGAGVIPIANLASGTPTGTKFIRDDGSLQLAGNLILTSTTDIAAATNSGDIAIDATKWYEVHVILTVCSAATDNIGVRFNNDTGSTYGYVRQGFTTAAGAVNANSTSATSILFTDVANPTTNTPFIIKFMIPPQGTASGKLVQIKGDSWGNNATTGQFSHCFGNWNNSATVTSFRLFTSGGSVTVTGTVYLYNITTS